MKDRIEKFLASEQISPAEFADKIGVQRSSMSHILNGRNYPSASFLQKMFQAYPSVNPRWLMIGEGSMNMESITKLVANTSSLQDLKSETNEDSGQTLFAPGIDKRIRDTMTITEEETESTSLQTNNSLPGGKADKTTDISARHQSQAQFSPSSEPEENFENPVNSGLSATPKTNNEKVIESILFIYTDKTFSVYRPS